MIIIGRERFARIRKRTGKFTSLTRPWQVRDVASERDCWVTYRERSLPARCTTFIRSVSPRITCIRSHHAFAQKCLVRQKCFFVPARDRQLWHEERISWRIIRGLLACSCIRFAIIFCVFVDVCTHVHTYIYIKSYISVIIRTCQILCSPRSCQIAADPRVWCVTLVCCEASRAARAASATPIVPECTVDDEEVLSHLSKEYSWGMRVRRARLHRSLWCDSCVLRLFRSRATDLRYRLLGKSANLLFSLRRYERGVDFSTTLSSGFLKIGNDWWADGTD